MAVGMGKEKLRGVVSDLIIAIWDHPWGNGCVSGQRRLRADDLHEPPVRL